MRKLTLHAEADPRGSTKDCPDQDFKLRADSGVDAVIAEHETYQPTARDRFRDRPLLTPFPLAMDDAVAVARLWNGRSEPSVVTL